MSTTFDHAAIRFLSEKENFKFALDVASHIDAVKKYLIISLWDKLYEKISKELREDIGNVKDWNLKQDNNMDGPFPGITLAPNSITNPVYTYRIEKECNIYHGIVATKEDGLSDHLLPLPEFSCLLDNLKQMQFKRNDIHWLGWRYSDCEYSDRDALLTEIAENSDNLSDRIAFAFVDDFHKLKALILNLNRSLPPEG